jgi:FkbM family methyltransferase
MSWSGALHQRVARAANRLTNHDHTFRRFVTPAYDVLLQALSLGRGVPRTVNGEEFLVDPRVRYLMLEAHEADVAAYVRSRIKAGDTILNIGANIGLHALPLARWSGPEGRVIAFEPNPATAAILARHVRMNALEGRVHVERSAVGREDGRARLFDTRAGSGISRIGAAHPYHGSQPQTSLEVPVVTVDAYCASRGIVPDWMIIDVEGFEFEVLRGARRTILDRASALSILVELHPYMWDDLTRQRDEAAALFRELNRRPIAIDGAADALERAGVVVLVAEAAKAPEARGGIP